MIQNKLTLIFWNKASNYSIIGCLVYAIFSRFFKKYVEGHIHPILLFVFGIIILISLIFCETMIFFLKRKAKRNA